MFPKLLILTDAARMAPSPDGALLAACLGGAKWFCVRDKSAAPRELLERFARWQRIAEKFGAQTFLNGRADLARAAHADGLHLPEGEIPVSAVRLTLGFHTPCGVSVHSVEGAKRAQSEGADYLLFGPVFPTLSHPGAPAAGLDGLRAVVQSVSVPVYAVGGIGAGNAASCLEAGAAGVAVISSVWSAPDVTRAVRDLRAALGERDAPTHAEQHAQEAASASAATTAAAGAPSGLAALIGRQSAAPARISGNDPGAA